MEKLIKFEDELTSLKMAELTGKKHKNVMRDIKDEIEKLGIPDNFNQLIFELVEYTDKKGETRPMYKMTKEGWLQIGARYDAKIRYTLISYVNKLENDLKVIRESPSYMINDEIERALAWVREQKEKMMLVQKIEEDRPKVKIAEKIMVRDYEYDMKQTAKLLEFKGTKQIGRNTLFDVLKKHGILQSNNEPYQVYINSGYFTYKAILLPNGEVYNQTRVTSKGLLWLQHNINNGKINFFDDL